MSFGELKDIVDGLHEFNPMMGHRGCRLAVSYPEIAERCRQELLLKQPLM